MRGSSGEGTAPRQSMRWSICFATIRARMRCSPAPCPAPHARHKLYEHYGFVRTGEIFDYEIVLRLDLHTGASPPVT
jgi:hypothetical protein